jgi:hypothetical protein
MVSKTGIEPKSDINSRDEALKYVAESQMRLMQTMASDQGEMPRGVDGRKNGPLYQNQVVMQQWGISQNEVGSEAARHLPREVDATTYKNSMAQISKGAYPSHRFDPQVSAAAVDHLRDPAGQNAFERPPMLESTVQNRAENILANRKLPQNKINEQLDQLQKASGWEPQAFRNSVASHVEERANKVAQDPRSIGLVQSFRTAAKEYEAHSTPPAAAEAKVASADPATIRAVEDLAYNHAVLRKNGIEGKPVDTNAMQKIEKDLAGYPKEIVDGATKQMSQDISVTVRGENKSLAKYDQDMKKAEDLAKSAAGIISKDFKPQDQQQVAALSPSHGTGAAQQSNNKARGS